MRPLEQLPAKCDRERRQYQHEAERSRDQEVRRRAGARKDGQRDQPGNRAGNAARGEQAGDAPIHMSLRRVAGRAADLHESRIQQVRAHGRDRRHAETQHQQRRHQRAAANTGEADDHADDEARYRVGKFDHGRVLAPEW
jgi:hypothetical protein